MDTVKRELREQDTRIIQAEVRDGKTQRDLYEKYGDLKQDKAVGWRMHSKTLGGRVTCY